MVDFNRTRVSPIARRKKTPPTTGRLLALVEKSLDDDKADDVVVIDLQGISNIADYMVIATGRSQRHLGAMTEHLRGKIKAKGIITPPPEGLTRCDWVLIDAGDVIVHLFRPEVRAFYNLEKMWSQALPELEHPSGSGRAGGLTA